ncbi:hypothetical protein PIB30_008719 [Stylosanthes scabra]|uniref:Protein kinase domain-containing protein n=1 Tax=Stylosanthes scabra TaxID=79078 RepID=A0ABU6U6S4_9FABA|nr:hypothetical protein [Stylosanthes scabra]
MELSGIIDVDTLFELSNLTSFSVIGNNFEGPMPEFKKIVWLKALFLSNNRFSGEIDDDAFEGMRRLKKVHLAENEFFGYIPKSIAELPKLLELDLSGNIFQGLIPQFHQKNLNFNVFDLSNNQLEGMIPESLINQDPSSFAGNKYLCGKPLTKSCNATPNVTFEFPSPRPKPNRHTLIIVITVAVIVVASILAVLFIRGRRPIKSSKKLIKTTLHTNQSAYNTSGAQSIVILTNDLNKEENGELNFVREDRRNSFDLQGLLRASAEVLGSGSFGSTYKAMVLNNNSGKEEAMVVKRFRLMNNVGKHEFYEHMRRLGSLSHPNLLPLVAFHYRKQDKFLVYDFGENGSLATHLHGRNNGCMLRWPTRLKIIKGVARGLAYLYTQFPNQRLPHGHLKSSNVILDVEFEPRLTEYGLIPVMNKSHALKFMAAYKSPESSHRTNAATEKTDVWCLGILILEVLTGRFPANYLSHGGENNADLASWVNTVVREEWSGEVFDEGIMGIRNNNNGSEGEMLKLLRIGMCCCEWDLESRWDWREALEKIEEVKENNNEITRDYDDNNSNNSYSYVSDGDLYSKATSFTNDDFSFPLTGNS